MTGRQAISREIKATRKLIRLSGRARDKEFPEKRENKPAAVSWQSKGLEFISSKNSPKEQQYLSELRIETCNFNQQPKNHEIRER